MLRQVAFPRWCLLPAAARASRCLACALVLLRLRRDRVRNWLRPRRGLRAAAPAGRAAPCTCSTASRCSPCAGPGRAELPPAADEVRSVLAKKCVGA
eukprot:12483214-Alexandrium_andersonii.AAC.1